MPSIIRMFDILIRGGIMSNIIHMSDIIQGMVLCLGVFLGGTGGILSWLLTTVWLCGIIWVIDSKCYLNIVWIQSIILRLGFGIVNIISICMVGLR